MNYFKSFNFCLIFESPYLSVYTREDFYWIIRYNASNYSTNYLYRICAIYSFIITFLFSNISIHCTSIITQFKRSHRSATQQPIITCKISRLMPASGSIYTSEQCNLARWGLNAAWQRDKERTNEAVGPGIQTKHRDGPGYRHASVHQPITRHKYYLKFGRYLCRTSIHPLPLQHPVTPNRCPTLWMLIVPVAQWLVT